MTPAPKMEKASEQARTRLREIVAELALSTPVVATQMFGMPSAKHAGGKTFLGSWGEDLVFKLSGQALAEALALPGAARFDPMHGRPMKQWVLVPAALADRWLDLARQAVQTDA